MSLTQKLVNKNEQFGAHNYHPLPVVLQKGHGVWVEDVTGKKYLDFLAAYSAVNQGHRHPKIIQALKEQADLLTLTSRAFFSEKLAVFLERLCQYSGYEKALVMNTGAEAVETAIKLARRWGNRIKGIDNGKQEIIVCQNNFHGRTTTIISFSTDDDARAGFGPYTTGFVTIPYDDAAALRRAITDNTCAFLVEPIQGEAGVILPRTGYLSEVRKICDEANILFIADEIQTGFGRTGKKFACDHENVRADVVCLGKALGGGVLPISAIVADDKFMQVFTPGSHGSTFGGNPLACAVGCAALDVLDGEHLAEKSQELGKYLRDQLQSFLPSAKIQLRGEGLLNAIEFSADFDAWPVCVALMEAGLLAKQTHGNIIRFTPPLIITKAELDHAISIIRTTLDKLALL